MTKIVNWEKFTCLLVMIKEDKQFVGRRNLMVFQTIVSELSPFCHEILVAFNILPSIPFLFNQFFLFCWKNLCFVLSHLYDQSLAIFKVKDPLSNSLSNISRHQNFLPSSRRHLSFVLILCTPQNKLNYSTYDSA